MKQNIKRLNMLLLYTSITMLILFLSIASCKSQTAESKVIKDSTSNEVLVEDKNVNTEVAIKNIPDQTPKLSATPSVKPATEPLAKPSAAPSVNKDSLPAQSKASFTEITRKEAGLDTISRLDFSKLNLNSRLNELLQQNNYKDADYAAGIALPVSSDENTYIITSRFTGRIIEDIKIGTDMEQVKSILGVPSIKLNSSYYYKTNNYYIGFKGNPKVQMAAIMQNPKEYDKDTLLTIFNQLSTYSTFDKIIENNKGFFERVRYVNGGERYAGSDNGIVLQDLPANKVLTVYNNFEGKLFRDEFKKPGRVILYQNYDSVISMIDSGMGSFLSVDMDLERKGVLSPSGKYKVIYHWYYSMGQCFTIRTTDNSRPDTNIQAYTNQGQYKWLSDDYILYIHAYEQVPYILTVGKTEQHINVLKELELLNNSGNNATPDYEIIEVGKDSFTLKNKINHTTNKIKFTISGGKIKLEKLPAN